MTQEVEEGKSIYREGGALRKCPVDIFSERASRRAGKRLRVNQSKKSAEVIVLEGKRGANRYRIGLTNKEGLNVKRFSIGNGISPRRIALLNENRLKTTKMITRVVQPFNLQRALEHVIANKGSAGVDGVSIRELRKVFSEKKLQLIEAIKQGNYQEIGRASCRERMENTERA